MTIYPLPACLFNPYVVCLPTRVVVNKTTLQKLNKCSRWATNSSCHRIDSHYSCIIFRENPANPKSFSQVTMHKIPFRTNIIRFDLCDRVQWELTNCIPLNGSIYHSKLLEWMLTGSLSWSCTLNYARDRESRHIVVSFKINLPIDSWLTN